PPIGRAPPPRARPRARRRARGPRGGSPNTCSCRSSLHSFLGFLKSSMRLDGAVRSRPVLHDVAACQVRQARVTLGTRLPRRQVRGPPAHRIDVEPRGGTTALRLATIVVAHLELRVFTTATRI